MRELKMKVYTSGGIIGPFDLSQHPMYWAHKLRDGERLLYTGRKDKNGSEIYEGDLVEENNEISVCVWMNEAGAFAFVPSYLYPCNLQTLTVNHAYDTFFENDVPENFVKVIGNIYENPELLEGEE